MQPTTSPPHMCIQVIGLNASPTARPYVLVGLAGRSQAHNTRTREDVRMLFLEVGISSVPLSILRLPTLLRLDPFRLRVK